MCEHVDQLSRLLSSNLSQEIQPMLPNHPAMLRIFIGNQFGCAQSKRDLLVHGFSISNIL